MVSLFILKCIVAQRLYGMADQDFKKEMLQNRVRLRGSDIYHTGGSPSHKMLSKYKEIFRSTSAACQAASKLPLNSYPISDLETDVSFSA